MDAQETQRLSMEERKELLDRVLTHEVALGARVESKMDVMAIVIAGQRRVTLAIDEHGQVLVDGKPSQPARHTPPAQVSAPVPRPSAVPNSGGGVVGFVMRNQLVAVMLGVVFLACIAAVIGSVIHPAPPPVPAAQSAPTLHEPSTADWASLHAFKTALEEAGASGRYVTGAELDPKMPNRVVIQVSARFMVESHAARTQFIQLAENLWQRVRDERKAGDMRGLILVLGPVGQRIGGSTVTGLAEVDE